MTTLSLFYANLRAAAAGDRSHRFLALGTALTLVLFAGFLFISHRYYPAYQGQVFATGLFFLFVGIPSFLFIRTPERFFENLSFMLIPFSMGFLERVLRKGVGYAVPNGWQYVFDPLVILLVLAMYWSWKKNSQQIRSDFQEGAFTWKWTYILTLVSLITNQFMSVDVWHRSLPFSIYHAVIFLSPLFFMRQKTFGLRPAYYFFIANAFYALPALIEIVVKQSFPLNAYDLLKTKMTVDFMIHMGDLLYGNSSHLPNYYILLLPLAFCILDHARLSVLKRAAVWVSFILMTYLFMAHYSRAAVLFMLAAYSVTFVYSWLRLKKFSLSILVFLACMIGPHVMSPDIASYFFNSLFNSDYKTPENFSTSDSSMAKRHEAGVLALKIIPEHLPMGCGWGAYPILDPTYTSPHNNFFLFLAEAGIPGGLFYIAWFALLVVFSWKAHRKKDSLSIYILVACWTFFIKTTLAGGTIIDSGEVAPGFLLSFFLVILNERLGPKANKQMTLKSPTSVTE